MKASELMIGDWVDYDPNVFNDDEYQPRLPSKRIQVARGEDIDLAEENCYSPIPLTEDILKANGWEKNDPNWLSVLRMSYKKDNHRFTLSCYIEKGKWTVYIHDAGITELNRFHPSYVHELQHALRLCGLSEYADNFKVNPKLIKGI